MKFLLRARIYVLKKEEGGRHTPFFTGYSPQFFFRSTDVTGKVNLAEGIVARRRRWHIAQWLLRPDQPEAALLRSLDDH